MAAPYLVPANADIDFLLAEIADALQLTQSQHSLAVQHYEAVAEWLAAPESLLAPFEPWIYPQGSMALETTVRPRTHDEYDLDLVCQMLPTGMPALEVYDAVHARLSAHKRFASMLEKKNRCVRLNYAGDFHLDIIAAQPDLSRGGTAILVPDRSLQSWTPSNPKAYVEWFRQRSEVTLAELHKKVDPVPQRTPTDEKTALAIAVQLMKRRRDLLCSSDVAPRSIVLTTLAAEYYSGSDCVLTAVAQILDGIKQRIAAAAPATITVCNPTNGGEKFCESFDAPGRYEAFKWFISQLDRDVERIFATRGIPELQRILAEFFGEEPVTKAVRSYGELLKARRDNKSLEFSGVGGLAIVTAVKGRARIAPPHRYFGG
jgi:hypothetical protein